MFEDVKSEKALIKLNKIGGGLEKIIVAFPCDKKVTLGISELEYRFKGYGNVQYDYAKRLILGYEHSKNCYHSRTGNLLLDDINQNKRIYIKSYYEKNKKELGENDKNA